MEEESKERRPLVTRDKLKKKFSWYNQQYNYSKSVKSSFISYLLLVFACKFLEFLAQPD